MNSLSDSESPVNPTTSFAVPARRLGGEQPAPFIGKPVQNSIYRAVSVTAKRTSRDDSSVIWWVLFYIGTNGAWGNVAVRPTDTAQFTQLGAVLGFNPTDLRIDAKHTFNLQPEIHVSGGNPYYKLHQICQPTNHEMIEALKAHADHVGALTGKHGGDVNQLIREYITMATPPDFNGAWKAIEALTTPIEKANKASEIIKAQNAEAQAMTEDSHYASASTQEEQDRVLAVLSEQFPDKFPTKGDPLVDDLVAKGAEVAVEPTSFLPGSDTVKVLDKEFPRENGQPVEDKVTDQTAVKTLGEYFKDDKTRKNFHVSARNLCKANGIEDSKLQDEHIHEVLGVESSSDFEGTPGEALNLIKESFNGTKTKASETAPTTPASAPIASTPVVEPAKVNEPIPATIAAVDIKPDGAVLIGEIVPEPVKSLQLVQPTNEIVLFDPRRSLDYVMQAHDLIAAMMDKKLLVESGKDESGNEIDGDYGKIAGSKKPALFKSGAEKLCEAFGLRPEFVTLPTAVSDWKEPFFYFHYKCELYRVSDGKLIATANGSCNSKEDKYGWRWLDLEKVPRKYRDALTDLETRGGRISEFDFAVEKSETTGKYGKAESYWKQFTEAIANGSAKSVDKKDSKGVSRKAWEIDAMQYRVPNSDIFSIVNTLDKMAQKRALVGAVLIGTAASRFFTQDIEDLLDFGTMAAA